MARREGQGAISRAQRACRAGPDAYTSSRQAWRAGWAASVSGCCARAASSRQDVEGRVGNVRERLHQPRRRGQQGGQRRRAAARWRPAPAKASREARRAASAGGCALVACTRQGVEGSKGGSVGGRLRAGGLRGWRRAAAAATTTPFEAPRSRGRRRRARDRARRRERLGVTTISR